MGEKRVERREEREERAGMHYREMVVWQKGMEIAREIYRLAPMLTVMRRNRRRP